MSLIISWLVLAFAVWVTAQWLDGVHLRGFGEAFVVAAIFGVLNVLLGKLLLAFFVGMTLGLGLLVLFVLRWVVDAILLKVTDMLTDRITIDGFGTTFLAALLMSLIGTGSEWLLQKIGWIAAT